MTPINRDADGESAVKPRASVRGNTPVFKSEALFEGKREVHIKHGETLYRLAITRFDKLILTK